MKKSEISILLGLAAAFFISLFADINIQAERIRQNTLRLHIIADDAGEQANRIKMQVKEEVSLVCGELLCRSESYEQAVNTAKENMDYIQAAVENTLRQLDAGYGAVCSLEKFYFDTTRYDGFTLPRGEYTALTVRLGEAEGKNWWCVVYPALCRSGRAEYREETDNTFIETDTFRIKFKAVELWQKAGELLGMEKEEKYDKI